MLVLLPPSERKAADPAGPPLDLASLSFPDLTGPRGRVLDALRALCAGPSDAARAVLGLSPGLAGEIGRNRELPVAGTRPAATLYTGVLYDALRLADLDPAARHRADRSLLVVSGLWGALRPADRIPPYRLAMGVNLPGTGPLAAFWRDPLGRLLPALTGTELILDLRSSPYAAAWRPRGAVAERVVTVRVLLAATRTTVSHLNKATKGRLVRDLLIAGDEPATPKDLAETLAGLGYAAELAAPPRPGLPWALDVLVEAA